MNKAVRQSLRQAGDSASKILVSFIEKYDTEKVNKKTFSERRQLRHDITSEAIRAYDTELRRLQKQLTDRENQMLELGISRSPEFPHFPSDEMQRIVDHKKAINKLRTGEAIVWLEDNTGVKQAIPWAIDQFFE